MEFLNLLGDNFYWLMTYIVPFLFVLTIVVFFHELGHFWVARWNKVDVDAFSIGIGPELIGFNDSRGTRWKLSALPLGGYVKFSGDETAASTPNREAIAAMDDSQREGAFELKTVGQRAAVVVAGPVANFILAIVIFAGSFMYYGRGIIEPVVSEVVAGGAAETAGLLPGDKLLRIDGQDITSFADIQRIVSISADYNLDVVVERNGKEETFAVTPRFVEQTDNFGNRMRLGMLGIKGDAGEANRSRITYGPVESVWEGVKETGFIITRTFGFLKDIIVGRQEADQLGGPIRIAKVSGQVATFGIAALLNLAAILSVSIGLLNLFPIPMLDGGHLVYYGIEALRGKPLSPRTQDIGFRIGLALVLMLMVFATFNDVMDLARS